MQRGLLVEFSCNSPTLYLIAHWRALLVVRSFVLEWRVVATTNNKGKLYAQVSKSGNTTKKVLKIKKAFPNLKADKIDNIQKIIKDNSKPKPRINMTTKDHSRKQVIVPINNDNKTKFIKDSSNYITNINRVLKNIKSETMIYFV